MCSSIYQQDQINKLRVRRRAVLTKGATEIQGVRTSWRREERGKDAGNRSPSSSMQTLPMLEKCSGFRTDRTLVCSKDEGHGGALGAEI